MHSIFAATRAALSRQPSRYLSILAVAALLIGNAASARGQSALDGFDPNANGSINSIVIQPDGKILIAGGFTTIAPNGGPAVTRNRVARLNPDGTLDTLFNPSADGIVADMVLQADGKIVIGGLFLNVGGVPRARIARLDPITGAPDSFDPSANGAVSALALQADGKILVGGNFNTFAGAITIGGQSRNNIARLDPATGMADSFNPNASNQVLALAVQADGKILAGGQFFGHNSIGGQNRFAIARLDPATGLADSFNPNVVAGKVFAITVQPDGKILIGGSFSNLGGQTRSRIARLDPTTGAPDSFNPNANGSGFDGPYVSDIVLQSDGKILAGGSFDSIGGQVRRNLARLDATSGMADAFDPNPNAAISAIAVQADGKVLIGGNFTSLAPNGGPPVTRNRIARLERDGGLDQTLNLNSLPSFNAAAVQPDGKILIGGYFTNVYGVPRQHIARLNPDGSLDLSFNAGASDNVNAILVQPNGKILVSGQFRNIGGQPRNGVARLDSNGVADSFDPNVFGTAYSMATQPDGKVLIGGAFQMVGGQPRTNVARVDGNTGTVDSFAPNADAFVGPMVPLENGQVLVGGSFTMIGGQPRRGIALLDGATGAAEPFNAHANDNVYSLVLQAGGNVLAGGTFTNIGAQARNRLARLNIATALADSFNPNVNGSVFSISEQADSKVLVAGEFTAVGGQLRNYIARLDSTTGVADSFNPNPNNYTYGIMPQNDGKLLVHGNFTAVAGQPRPSHFARLSNDTAALQELLVRRDEVVWNRGGSSPRLSRATFEYSTDGAAYTALGSGSVSGSNWTLSGLNLPVGSRFFVRVRGEYVGGRGSASVVEAVREVFAQPLQLNRATSRKAHGSAGEFDIELPLTGAPGVECRSSGGAHTLVISFSNSVAGGSANVTAGKGNVSGAPSFTGNTMTVNLSDVSDVQRITVTLSGITDTFGQTLPETAVSVNMLIGDINGSRTVNASDIGAVKAQSGAPVTGANFRSDVAANGTITATDIALVKSRSGQTVP